ncbi:hypothetical protein V2J09_009718 [Rumex salicifolius]
MSNSQDLLLSLFHNRRLLLQAAPQSPNSGEPIPAPPSNGFDANVVMVLSVLLCAIMCSVGLSSIIRCAFRCTTLVSNETNNNNNTNPSSLANTGIKRKALKTFPTVSYSNDLKLPGLGTECVICLSEFAHGEKVRLLPKCNHGFHVRCIDKWLNSHSSCPTCRHCLIQTCQKIVGCSTQSSSSPPQPPPPPPVLPQVQPAPQEWLNSHSSCPTCRHCLIETCQKIVGCSTTQSSSSIPPPPPPPPVLPPQPQEVVIHVAPLEREDMMHSCRGTNS